MAEILRLSAKGIIDSSGNKIDLADLELKLVDVEMVESSDHISSEDVWGVKDRALKRCSQLGLDYIFVSSDSLPQMEMGQSLIDSSVFVLNYYAKK